MAYDKTNRFTLSRNERKDQDTHPDFIGTLNVDGKDYWLSAWTKEANGKKFFSGSIKPKDQAPAPKATPPAGGYGAMIDDSIPFMMEWR